MNHTLSSILSIIALVSLLVSCDSPIDPTTNKPTAAFNGAYEITRGQVQLTNQSKHANHYRWDFGDGETSTEESPTHSYAKNGEYNIHLVAYNDQGASTTFIRPVIIQLVPGQIVIWLNHKGVQTDIHIGGIYKGTITQYYSSPPSCGQDGSVTVELPAGDYTFTGKEHGRLPKSWAGQIRVYSGLCTAQALGK